MPSEREEIVEYLDAIARRVGREGDYDVWEDRHESIMYLFDGDGGTQELPFRAKYFVDDDGRVCGKPVTGDDITESMLKAARQYKRNMAKQTRAPRGA